MPVTLGIVAQDRVCFHESSSREPTIRAAVLAENDEIIYDQNLSVPVRRYGYVCKREIFAASEVPAKGAIVALADYFRKNFIWDDNRVREAGFGREPERECLKNGACPNKVPDPKAPRTIAPRVWTEIGNPPGPVGPKTTTWGWPIRPSFPPSSRTTAIPPGSSVTSGGVSEAKGNGDGIRGRREKPGGIGPIRNIAGAARPI